MPAAGTAAAGNDSEGNLCELEKKARGIRAGFKRPRGWVLGFGWGLALCAGIVNVVAFRAWGLYVSHVTGSTAAIGMRIEGVHRGRHEFNTLGEAFCLVCAFLFGAFACGLLIDKNHMHFGGKSFYGFALIFNAVLLAIATALEGNVLPASFAAAACGLQNAMCTSHFGAVVRTTHVTGTVTDIGSTLGRMAMILLGRRCRWSQLDVVELAEIGVDGRKLLVLGPMWLSFLVGCIIGAYLESKLEVFALLIPASLTFCVGLLYLVFRERLKTYIKRVEKGRLDSEIKDMKGMLERTVKHLAQERNRISFRQDGSANMAAADTTQVAVEIGEDLEEMLEAMRDVEANVGDLYVAERGCPRTPQPSQASGNPASIEV